MKLLEKFYIIEKAYDEDSFFLITPYRFPSVECPTCNNVWGGLCRRIFDSFPNYNLCEAVNETKIISTNEYRNIFGKFEDNPSFPIAKYHFHPGGYIGKSILFSYEKIEQDFLLPQSNILFPIIVSSNVLTEFERNSITGYKPHRIEQTALLDKKYKRKYKREGSGAISQAFYKNDFEKYSSSNDLWEIEVVPFVNTGIKVDCVCQDCGDTELDYNEANVDILRRNWNAEDIFWFGSGVPAFSEKCINILHEFDPKLVVKTVEKFIEKSKAWMDEWKKEP